MATWKPLSVRTGAQLAPEEPYESIEPHMHGPLGDWVDARVSSALMDDPDMWQARLRILATRLRWPSDKSGGNIISYAKATPTRYLDFVEALVHWWPEPAGEYFGSDEMLGLVLETCGSVWTVSPDGLSLQRRVDETAQEQLAEALAPGDLAAGELAEAWRCTFGRNPNPSDAWDHAIKAVEHVYVPLVVEKKAAAGTATLSDVIGQLGPRQNEHGWETTISVDPADPTSGVKVVRDMLRSLWGNPDRHGGSPAGRPPEQAEAEALGHLAVTLVQWGRNGVLRKKVKT